MVLFKQPTKTFKMVLTETAPQQNTTTILNLLCKIRCFRIDY